MTDIQQGLGPSDWFGQPRGLTILFLTETWERFSFYGMRALLVYYMTQQLSVPQSKASLIYGAYTAFVFLTPIIGGVISDRWLGRRLAVMIGGAIMAAGHFMMTSESLFYPALVVIGLGNGLFLPSLPSQIASLYTPDDPRRGSAFNVYYIGVNLGAFLAPLVCGTLGEIYGWHWGFGAAGIGMLAGLVIYSWGTRWLPSEMSRSAPPAATGKVPDEPLPANVLYLFIGVAAIIVIFRGAYEQLGNTVALWADQGVDRTLSAGATIPMTWFQSLNSLVVIVATPFLVWYWTRLARSGREAPPLTKMSTGAAIVCAAYLMLAAASTWAELHGVRVSWVVLAAFVVILTAGELHVLPVGLGLFGRLAPRRLAATVIAGWFLAGFAGNLIAGALGTLWSRMSHAEFFALMAAIAAATAVLLRLFDWRTRGVTLVSQPAEG